MKISPDGRWGCIAVSALLGAIVTSLVACSGSQSEEPRSRVVLPPEPVRPAAILSQAFENLPSPALPPLPFVTGSSTLAVLPDTQFYSIHFPWIFERQTEWIVDHREERDIRFVLHLGDITETGGEEQWRVAASALHRLDGHVPYALAVGNHDYDGGAEARTRDNRLSEFFPVRGFRQFPTFGGTYNAGVMDNSFHLFSAGGREWVAVVLEWGPRRDVVEWADKVLRVYADRTAIIVTHAYMFNDGTRQDHNVPDHSWNPHDYPTADLPGGVHDGQQLWEALVRKHGNVAFVLSGHVLGDGAALLSSEGDEGNTVHQMLSNYQMMADGGQGYLRLLELLPDGRTVHVKTYSPVLDDYLTGSEQQFKLEIDVRLGPAKPMRQAANPA